MSTSTRTSRAIPATDPSHLGPVLIVAGLAFLVHLPWLMQYGWFRDELYYRSCALRLDWGYVDQPPLSIALLTTWRWLVGDSLFAMRLVPAAAHAVTVLVAARLARALGGGTFAQALAGIGVFASLVYLAIGHYYSMNALDPLLWGLAALALLRALARQRTTEWLAFGAIVGIGLLNKLSMVWCAGGLALGVLATPQRRSLGTPGPWLALALAAVLFSPHLIWQAAHGWPTLEFVHNATAHKMLAISILGFLAGQVLAMNPLTAPIWLAGLVRGLRPGADPGARLLAVQYLAVLALLILARSVRLEYLTPAYPALLALGGVAVERATEVPARRWGRVLAVSLPLAGMMALLPLVVPVLPIGAFVRYQAALGRKPHTEERHRMGTLPQQYADMFGWPEFADSVARAAATLTPDERERAIVIVGNYGEAGALERFGTGRIPRVACQHNSWYLWGPPDWDGGVAILVGRDSSECAREFSEVRVVGVAGHPLAMPYEQDLPIVVARGFRPDLRTAWVQGKKYN